MPVFVANGESDPMILPHFSYLLAGLIPQARVKIYPDAAHGFLFQHHAEFARDVEASSGSEELGAAGTASRASACTARNNAVLSLAVREAGVGCTFGRSSTGSGQREGAQRLPGATEAHGACPFAAVTRPRGRVVLFDLEPDRVHPRDALRSTAAVLWGML